MKILLISDSHQASLTHLPFEKYDAILHCGDYGKSLPILKEHHVYYVQGNCDFQGEDALHLSLFGKEIYMTHGHHEQVKFDLNRLIYKAMEEKVSVCMFGHTHQLLCFKEENILFLNPGSYPNSYIEITEDTIILHQNKTEKRIHYRW